MNRTATTEARASLFAEVIACEGRTLTLRLLEDPPLWLQKVGACLEADVVELENSDETYGEMILRLGTPVTEIRI